jgi:hypothetical protein
MFMVHPEDGSMLIQMLVSTFKTTRYHNPEDHDLNNQGGENFHPLATDMVTETGGGYNHILIG